MGKGRGGGTEVDKDDKEEEEGLKTSKKMNDK
jgi:hypothetical protein